MTDDDQGAPDKPLRRRRSFIGCDPEYTGADTSSEGLSQPAADPPMEAATPPERETPASAEVATDAATTPEDRTPRKAPTQARARASEPKRVTTGSTPDAGEEKPRRDIVLRLRIGPEATEQLEELGRTVGQPTSVVLKHVRKAVVAEFRLLLEGKKRPEGGVTHRNGISDAVSITLQDHERDRARAWFDPLGLGSSAMSDFARPVLTKLYEDTIRDLAQR